MVIALGAAVCIVLQLIGVDQFMAVCAFEPAAETIPIGGLDFDFRFVS